MGALQRAGPVVGLGSGSVMQMKWIALLTVQVLAASLSWAEGDIARGKALYATCVSCHGEQGSGNVELAAPNLAHLPAVYVVAQLDKFRAGVRGGPNDSAAARQMAAMASTLADEQACLSIYFHNSHRFDFANKRAARHFIKHLARIDRTSQGPRREPAATVATRPPGGT